MGDSIEIDILGYALSLRRSEARVVLVGGGVNPAETIDKKTRAACRRSPLVLRPRATGAPTRLHK